MTKNSDKQDKSAAETAKQLVNLAKADIRPHSVESLPEDPEKDSNTAADGGKK